MNHAVSMRTTTQSTLGGPEVLSIVEAPIPEPRTNEVLVRIAAASLNPTDWKHRATGGFLGQPPFTLGWDLAGTVVATGVGVATFAPGDDVFGMLTYPYGHGTHAEYVAAPARYLVKKPGSLTMVEAAALPLVSLTAWQALIENAALQPGERVLIHAAAGGVGHVAAQIAKARGAHVFGTASAAKHEFLRSVGVDAPIDYHSEDFVTAAPEMDVVLDTIGSDAGVRSLSTLREGGRLVSILPIGSEKLYVEADRLGVEAKRMLVDSSRSGLAAITDLVEAGALRPTISATFPLADIAEAHRAGETGRTAGKIVITME